MSPEIQKHTQKIRHRAEVLAVEALDDLVSDVIKANRFGVSRTFLDWVNNNATEFVVDCLKKSATKDYLQAAINSENARMTMRKLVDGWVTPHIHQQFKSIASSTWGLDATPLGAGHGRPTQHALREIDFVI